MRRDIPCQEKKHTIMEMDVNWSKTVRTERDGFAGKMAKSNLTTLID